MHAGGVEEVDQGVAQPKVVGELLLAAAVVEVLVGALVEALPQSRLPRVDVVQDGVMRAMVPVPGRRIWYRQAARVSVS